MFALIHVGRALSGLCLVGKLDGIVCGGSGVLTDFSSLLGFISPLLGLSSLADTMWAVSDELLDSPFSFSRW